MAHGAVDDGVGSDDEALVVAVLRVVATHHAEVLLHHQARGLLLVAATEIDGGLRVSSPSRHYRQVVLDLGEGLVEGGEEVVSQAPPALHVRIVVHQHTHLVEERRLAELHLLRVEGLQMPAGEGEQARVEHLRSSPVEAPTTKRLISSVTGYRAGGSVNAFLSSTRICRAEMEKGWGDIAYTSFCGRLSVSPKRKEVRMAPTT